MVSLGRQVLSTLLVFLLAVPLSLSGTPDASLVTRPPTTGAPAAPGPLPDGLLDALLDASAQPFGLGAEGYQAHSGGLEFTLRGDGLQATADGLAWKLSLDGFGRGVQLTSLPAAEIVQAGARLECRRGVLTEWYRDTALGLEQGFTIHQAPAGTGRLVLQLYLSAGLVGMPDADGRGLTLVAPGGKALRYDHLRAWDAGGMSLDARLLYREGRILLQVDDQGAAYPLTIDPLVYVEQKVDAPGGGLDYFGSSVAVDGDTAVVGMPGDNVGGNADQGSAYVFVRSGTTWSLQQQLTASDGAAADKFGASVALSGDTALVGASGDDVSANAGQGSAYVFVRSGTAWSEQAHLLASDGAAWDAFGASVALEGDTALVGAPNDNVFFSDQGSAYVYARSGTNWSEQAALASESGTQGAHFGSSVALSNNVALVGAPEENIDGSTGQGAAYIFSGEGMFWTLSFTLTAFDGAAEDNLGASVSLEVVSPSSATFLVGAPGDDVNGNVDQGSAYVFVQQGGYISLQQHLVAADGVASDFFGNAVALDGETALVGAYEDVVGGNTDQGSVYVWTRSGTAWSLQQQLTASDGAAGDHFGSAVALSGETALVGAKWDQVDAYKQGSAYVFVRSGTTWSEQAHYWVVSEDSAGDWFGYSVAIDGDTAIVGAPNVDFEVNTAQGAAYIFVRSGTTWSLQQRLLVADGVTYDYFGSAVALDGDTAVVGAPGDDIGATDQGSAYVFFRTGTSWALQQQLVATDSIEGDRMGSSVAISGDTVMVGVPGDDLGATIDVGTAFAFVRSGVTWSEQAHLSASDGEAGDCFGHSVAISGDTALVSALLDNVGGNFWQGSAYVLVRSGTTWSEQAKLTAANGAVGDFFGESVALEGDTALVGAEGADVGGNSDQGLVYVFVRTGTAWSEQARLAAHDGAASDCFGYSVALSGNTALVGAHHDTVGANGAQGSAYVLVRSGTTWSEQGKVTASDGAQYDSFGVSVALWDNRALVGAYNDDIGDNADQGSAYFYDLTITVSFRVYLPLIVRSAP